MDRSRIISLKRATVDANRGGDPYMTQGTSLSEVCMHALTLLMPADNYCTLSNLIQAWRASDQCS